MSFDPCPAKIFKQIFVLHKETIEIRREIVGIPQEQSGDIPVGTLLPFSVCFSDVFLQEPIGTF